MVLNLLGYFLQTKMLSVFSLQSHLKANNDTANETEPAIAYEIKSVVHVEETNNLSVPEDFFGKK